MAKPGMYRKVRCPLCGSDRHRLHLDLKGKKPPFRMVRCNACSLVYMNPQLTEEYLNSIYSDERYYKGGIDYTFIDERADEKARMIANLGRLKSIERYVNKGMLLDIGCSFGSFLIAARKRDWKIQGVDISSYAVRHLKSMGIPAFRGIVEDSRFKASSFDCITMFETIEHLPDPSKAMKKCYSLLKEEGMMVIQTGNVDSLYSWLMGRKNSYLVPGHIVYYSQKTLVALMKKAGFRRFFIFAGDDVGISDRIRSIMSMNKSLLSRVLLSFKWTTFYLMRLLFFNKPVLGTITLYARK